MMTNSRRASPVRLHHVQRFHLVVRPHGRAVHQDALRFAACWIRLRDPSILTDKNIDPQQVCPCRPRSGSNRCSFSSIDESVNSSSSSSKAMGRYTPNLPSTRNGRLKNESSIPPSTGVLIISVPIPMLNESEVALLLTTNCKGEPAGTFSSVPAVYRDTLPHQPGVLRCTSSYRDVVESGRVK